MRLRRERELHENGIILFVVVFALIFARYCCYGFEYYYQLDDYIQYHNYTSSWERPIDAIMALGMLAARPLAGCADLLVWANFFPNMIVGVAIVSAMYAASACVFKDMWNRHFGTGYTFIVVYALLPLGLEGTYWMSASTRIITGLFFAALSLWCFDRWCDNGGRTKLALYIVLQLLAYGFYEQVLVFSCAATILVALINRAEVRRRSLWGLFSIVNACIYFLFVTSFPDSALYGEKTAYILPFSGYYWKEYLLSVLGQVKNAFMDGGFYIIVKGFKRGLSFLLADMNWMYAAAVLVLLFLLYNLARRDDGKSARKPIALLVGALLALAPLAPFFFVENSWFSLRGTVASFCGLAIIADVIISFIVSRTRKPGVMAAWFVTAAALVFCVSSVSEMHDYRETTKADTAFTRLLYEKLYDDGNLAKELSVGILNVEPSYLEDQNYYWHEHIHGVTESGWALTGSLTCYADEKSASVTPIPADPMYRPWNHDAMQLDLFDVLYLYDGETLTRVRIEPEGTGWALYDGDNYLGSTWEEDNYGYLELG